VFTNNYFFRAKYMTQSGAKRDAHLSADIATVNTRSEAACNLPRQVQYLRTRLSATKTMGALLTFMERIISGKCRFCDTASTTNKLLNNNRAISCAKGLTLSSHTYVFTKLIRRYATGPPVTRASFLRISFNLV
jgi:hypothetical protein